MKDYVIITDSASDLDKTLRDSIGVDYIQMPITYNGKESYCSLEWEYFSPKQFYDDLRAGIQYKTSQISIDTYERKFEQIIKSGKDILSLTCSSGLSGSINSSTVARNNLLEKYPDAKIRCVDTLRGSLGQGLIVCKAAELKKGGKSVDEVAEWVESNRLNFHQVGSVYELKYLKRAGRVTGMAAFMSKIFDIKPIIIADTKGQNNSIAKVRGRQTSIREALAYVKENIIAPEEQVIFLVNADCAEDAQKIKTLLLDNIKCKDVYINSVGPAIGATVGPGMFGIYFYGKPVTR
jgi:DegV family protein with EDD domain